MDSSTINDTVQKANESFKKRKQFKQQYKDLFEVLFKIPDKDLHSRVVSAINDTSYCVYCRKKAIITKPAGVQTEDHHHHNHESSSVCSSGVSSSPPDLNSERIIHFKSYKTQGIRKRKRTKKGPEVVQNPQPEISNIPVNMTVKRKCEKIEPIANKRRCSQSSVGSVDSAVLMKVMKEVHKPDELTEEQIQNKMIFEFQVCLVYNIDGLLPIQESLKQKDENRFQRQLFVLAFKKINLNELYTNDDSQLNLIELAIKSKCPLFFFKKLLDNGVLIDGQDEDGNTAVNLVCKWMGDNFTDVLEFILTKISLDILKIGNLEGMTPIHHCVIRNSFKMLKTILDYIDESLEIPLIPNYLDHKLETENDFFAFYKLAYNSINHRITSPSRETNLKKMNILNMREMKSGRTALFQAAHLQFQHICLMLLNHYASPDIKEHSGIDVITYRHTEGAVVDVKTKYMDDVFLNVSLVLAKHKFDFKCYCL